MLTIRRLIGLLAIGVLAAACGGTGGATPTASGDASQGATPTLPGDTGTVVSNAPDVSATQYVETEGVPAGGFKATVQGALEGDWEGLALADTYPPRTGTTLTLVSMDGSNSYGVLIEIPAGTQPGTYTLKSYIDAFDGVNIADFGAQFSNSGTNSLDLYTTITNGTLILSQVEPFTGRFEFEATNDDGGAVNVVGTFNQVAVTTTDTGQ